jgi:hypothetical protein
MFEVRSVNLFLVTDASWTLVKEGIICSFSNAPVEKPHWDEVAVIHPQRDSGIFFLEIRA